jgi:hypothetical protein
VECISQMHERSLSTNVFNGGPSVDTSMYRRLLRGGFENIPMQEITKLDTNVLLGESNTLILCISFYKHSICNYELYEIINFHRKDKVKMNASSAKCSCEISY